MELSLEFKNLLVLEFEQEVQFLELSSGQLKVVTVLANLNIFHKVVKLLSIQVMILVTLVKTLVEH